MTTFNREPNASLCRYNARKRELRSSMLEYTQRFRSIHLLADQPSPTDTSPLEIRARRKLIARHSDSGPLLRRLNHSHHPLPHRPFSFDDKILLKNKNTHPDIVINRSRDTKSEHHSSLHKTLNNSPRVSMSGPPNSPNSDRSESVRVSFVSASDLYDLVEFVPNSKSPRSPFHSRVADGIKLNEQIDSGSEHRTERKKAWPQQKVVSENGIIHAKETKQSSCDDIDGTLGGFITGKAISHDPKPVKKDKSIQASKARQSLSTLPVIKSADRDEIYPLNVFLETAMFPSKEFRSKLRHRPKRAKRMQLHKSELVAIPEDVHAHNVRASMESETEEFIAPTLHGATLGDDNGQHPRDEMDIHKSGVNINESPRRNESQACISGHKSSSSRRKNNKLKQSNQHEKACKVLDNIIIKNSIYPTLPWERNDIDCAEKSTTALTYDPVKDGKVKRLVFLRDKPQASYRR